MLALGITESVKEAVDGLPTTGILHLIEGAHGKSRITIALPGPLHQGHHPVAIVIAGQGDVLVEIGQGIVTLLQQGLVMGHGRLPLPQLAGHDCQSTNQLRVIGQAFGIGAQIGIGLLSLAVEPAIPGDVQGHIPLRAIALHILP